MHKILIVEDEFIIGFGIQHILEKNNYEICGIYSKGEEAIQKALSLKPSLILMDINLAGEIDGIEASEEIKKHLDIPIIFLTSYVDNITVTRAKKSEPFAYLVKPVDSKELLITIEMALYKHEMQKLINEKENWFKSVLKHLSDGVIATFNDFRIKFFNDAATEIFSNLSDLHFNNIFDLNIYNYDNIKLISIDDFILNQTTNVKFNNKFLEITANKIINDKFELAGYVFVIKDISQKIQLENEKEQNLSKLKNALDEIQKLSGQLIICSSCQKFKDENNQWLKPIDYFINNKNIQISQELCPNCQKTNSK
jgi:CheY-like chemotaxis protein